MSVIIVKTDCSDGSQDINVLGNDDIDSGYNHCLS